MITSSDAVFSTFPNIALAVLFFINHHTGERKALLPLCWLSNASTKNHEILLHKAEWKVVEAVSTIQWKQNVDRWHVMNSIERFACWCRFSNANLINFNRW